MAWCSLAWVTKCGVTTGHRMTLWIISPVSLEQSKGGARALIPNCSLTSVLPLGLCCCPTLKIYACSSLDCTIRIWTRENLLLRWAGAIWCGGS